MEQEKILKKYKNLKDFLKFDEYKGKAFLEHLLKKMDFHINEWWKILILTLTKKSSEEISNFLISKWYKAFYLHSEISTIDRWEIIKKLKLWKIDIIVWINLLREGIDLPEVSLIAILDADKEGFLRSTTSLIQIIWRASRNPKWEVILYADRFTESIIKSIYETYRRREIQINYNKKYWITPKLAHSNVKNIEIVKNDDDYKQDFFSLQKNKKKLKRMTIKEKNMILRQLNEQLKDCIKKRDFEQASVIRDQIQDIENM